MADISDINSAQTVKVVGADATGVEQTPVQATANGGLHTNLRNNAGTELGTVTNPIVCIAETSSRANNQQVYSAQTLSTNIGTTETAFLLLKNPNASGKILRILKIIVGTNGSGVIRLYHTPTISANGNALAAVSRYVKTAPTAAVVTPFTAPTISANGTAMGLWYTSPQVGSEVYLSDGDIQVDPNFNLLITAQNSANNVPTAVTVIWAEV